MACPVSNSLNGFGKGFQGAIPRGALAQIGRLGPNLRLDEPTTSHEWIRFDAPGDCQLMLREDFISIDGFNEDMLLGYHVDSNLSRRMLLHRGSIDSLEGHLAGYHCNHNRTRTLYHGTAVQNDVQKFYYAVDQSALTTQRTSWGLAHVDVEEVPLRGHVGADTAATFVGVMPSRPRSSSDALDAPFSLTYDSGHVLPFIADSLLLSRRDVTVGYIGANHVLKDMLAASVAGLGFARPLLAAGFDDTTAIDRAAATADVFIIDLGVDVSEAGGSLDRSRTRVRAPTWSASRALCASSTLRARAVTLSAGEASAPVRAGQQPGDILRRLCPCAARLQLHDPPLPSPPCDREAASRP